MSLVDQVAALATRLATEFNSVRTALTGKVDTTRTVTAGTGLSGGGDLSTNRTLAVSYGSASGTAVQGNDTRVSVKPYPPVDLTDAATVAINAALGTHFRLPAGGNRTIGIPSTPTDGQVIVIEVLASGGARTITLTTGSAGSFKFGTDITALTATTSGAIDYIQAVYRTSTSRWHVIGYVKGY